MATSPDTTVDPAAHEDAPVASSSSRTIVSKVGSYLNPQNVRSVLHAFAGGKRGNSSPASSAWLRGVPSSPDVSSNPSLAPTEPIVTSQDQPRSDPEPEAPIPSVTLAPDSDLQAQIDQRIAALQKQKEDHGMLPPAQEADLQAAQMQRENLAAPKPLITPDSSIRNDPDVERVLEHSQMGVMKQEVDDIEARIRSLEANPSRTQEEETALQRAQEDYDSSIRHVQDIANGRVKVAATPGVHIDFGKPSKENSFAPAPGEVTLPTEQRNLARAVWNGAKRVGIDMKDNLNPRGKSAGWYLGVVAGAVAANAGGDYLGVAAGPVRAGFKLAAGAAVNAGISLVANREQNKIHDMYTEADLQDPQKLKEKQDRLDAAEARWSGAAKFMRELGKGAAAGSMYLGAFGLTSEIATSVASSVATELGLSSTDMLALVDQAQEKVTEAASAANEKIGQMLPLESQPPPLSPELAAKMQWINPDVQIAGGVQPVDIAVQATNGVEEQAAQAPDSVASTDWTVGQVPDTAPVSAVDAAAPSPATEPIVQAEPPVVTESPVEPAVASNTVGVDANVASVGVEATPETVTAQVNVPDAPQPPLTTEPIAVDTTAVDSVLAQAPDVVTSNDVTGAIHKVADTVREVGTDSVGPDLANQAADLIGQASAHVPEDLQVTVPHSIDEAIGMAAANPDVAAVAQQAAEAASPENIEAINRVIAEINANPEIVGEIHKGVIEQIPATYDAANELLAAYGIDPQQLPENMYEQLQAAIQSQFEVMAQHDVAAAMPDGVPADPDALTTSLAQGQEQFASTVTSPEITQQVAPEIAPQIETYISAETKLADAVKEAVTNTGERVETVDVPYGSNVGELLGKAGHTITWGPQDAELLGAHIAANYDTLTTMWGQKDLPGGVHFPVSRSELVDVITKAKGGDTASLKQLQDALHWIPAKKGFSVIKTQDGIKNVLGALGYAG